MGALLNLRYATSAGLESCCWHYPETVQNRQPGVVIERWHHTIYCRSFCEV